MELGSELASSMVASAVRQAEVITRRYEGTASSNACPPRHMSHTSHFPRKRVHYTIARTRYRWISLTILSEYWLGGRHTLAAARIKSATKYASVY